mmetsp:Transcript_29915/g.61149  ORF Transcript_29915/g.61149 Transcript_29915/m.61149 type:complete len:228 (-) Transcript_29915:350-1033(-)
MGVLPRMSDDKTPSWPTTSSSMSKHSCPPRKTESRNGVSSLWFFDLGSAPASRRNFIMAGNCFCTARWSGENPDEVDALMSAPASRRSLATAMALRSCDRPATAEAGPAENSPPLTAQCSGVRPLVGSRKVAFAPALRRSSVMVGSRWAAEERQPEWAKVSASSSFRSVDTECMRPSFFRTSEASRGETWTLSTEQPRVSSSRTMASPLSWALLRATMRGGMEEWMV